MPNELAPKPRYRWAAIYTLLIVLAAVILVSFYAVCCSERKILELALSPDITPTTAPSPSEAVIQGVPENHGRNSSVPDPITRTAETEQPPQKSLTITESKFGWSFLGLPAELQESLSIAVAETLRGNNSNAALAALDAIELSPDFPSTQEYLHQLAGWNYEQAGLIDFAIEQYQLALALNPSQQRSYEGMRRLDAEFAGSHPALAKPQLDKDRAE